MRVVFKNILNDSTVKTYDKYLGVLENNSGNISYGYTFVDYNEIKNLIFVLGKLSWQANFSHQTYYYDVNSKMYDADMASGYNLGFIEGTNIGRKYSYNSDYRSKSIAVDSMFYSDGLSIKSGRGLLPNLGKISNDSNFIVTSKDSIINFYRFKNDSINSISYLILLYKPIQLGFTKNNKNLIVLSESNKLYFFSINTQQLIDSLVPIDNYKIKKFLLPSNDSSGIFVSDMITIRQYKMNILASISENHDNPVKLEIAPNPASDFIEISVGANGRSPLQSDVRIFNIYGQTVLSVGVQNLEPLRIDVFGLAPGMYFVRIGDKVGKIMKL